MGQIIQSAFSEARPLLMSRKGVYFVFMLIAALVWIFALVRINALHLQSTVSMNYNLFGVAFTDVRNLYITVAIDLVTVLGGILAWFALPAAVRTVDASFGMSVGRFFGIIGIAIVVGVVVGIGMGVPYGLGFLLLLKSSILTMIVAILCFVLAIVFVFLIAIKWSQVMWAYLLREPPNPFAASWHLTTGQFWETLFFTIVLGIAVAIPLYVGAGVAIWIAAAVPALGIVTVPAALFVYVFALNFGYLAQVRWFVRLRELSRAATSPPAV